MSPPTIRWRPTPASWTASAGPWHPVFAGEEGICSGCGVATLSISYYDLGYTTGEMAAQILTGEADISTMPIQYTSATKKYNKTICDELGLTVPEGYEAIEA